MRQDVLNLRAEQPHSKDAPSKDGPSKDRAQKSEQAFRTISEVSELLDTPAHVLRFWESKFSQVKPMKRGGGRRYYRPEDVSLLRGIRELLYVDGLTIKGVQKVLREQGQKHVANLVDTPDAVDTPAPKEAAPEASAPTPDVNATVARLEALRNRLRQS